MNTKYSVKEKVKLKDGSIGTVKDIYYNGESYSYLLSFRMNRDLWYGENELEEINEMEENIKQLEQKLREAQEECEKLKKQIKIKIVDSPGVYIGVDSKDRTVIVFNGHNRFNTVALYDGGDVVAYTEDSANDCRFVKKLSKCKVEAIHTFVVEMTK